jgi:hypothetical protein
VRINLIKLVKVAPPRCLLAVLPAKVDPRKFLLSFYSNYFRCSLRKAKCLRAVANLPHNKD